MPPRPRYSATLTGGPLMLPESRRVARLLLTDPDPATWLRAIRVDNLLQKNTPATAMRQGRLIRDRLDPLPRAAWELVAQGSQEAALQVLLGAAVLHSDLLGDFMRQVLAAHHRRLDLTLTPNAWEPFLAECQARDAGVAAWTASTRAKLWQVIVRMLVEARYLDSARSLNLRRPDLHPDTRCVLTSVGAPRLIATLELQP